MNEKTTDSIEVSIPGTLSESIALTKKCLFNIIELLPQTEEVITLKNELKKELDSKEILRITKEILEITLQVMK
ncbi:hypothetical protein KAU33_03960 [Candidatus Dependentiae bacterium]|nr:hypothetical protein [Candidatus Dependentiae bacterium]